MRPASLTSSDYYATTSSGVQYQVKLDPITDIGIARGRSVSVVALVSWSESIQFLEDCVGYTTWDGTSQFLQRTLPLRCPWYPELYCDQYEMERSGCYDDRLDPPVDPSTGWPDKDWCTYRLRFSRPPYNILPDSAMVNPGDERKRYVSVRRLYTPYERRVSGWGFIYDDSDDQSGNWKEVADETVFIPEHTITVVATWHQIPEDAVPWGAIAGMMGYVNNATWELFEMRFEKHQVLFRGLQDQVERYQGADGSWYYDLPYIFEIRPVTYGWNGYTRAQIDANGRRTYGRWRRAVPGETYSENLPLPYPEADLKKLFIPGATVP